MITIIESLPNRKNNFGRHRVVDGVLGAQFLQTFKALMEEPVRMLV